MQAFIYMDKNQAFSNGRAVGYQVDMGREKEGKNLTISINLGWLYPTNSYN